MNLRVGHIRARIDPMCICERMCASRYCEPCVGQKEGARDLCIQANGVAFKFHEIRPFLVIGLRPNWRQESDHKVARWIAFDSACLSVVILMEALMNSHIERAKIMLVAEALTMIAAL